MTRSRIVGAVWLLSLLTSAAYARSIAYDGKTPIASGSASSISLNGTSAGCAGVLIESIDTGGCLLGITSLSFAPGDTAGTTSYIGINSYQSYNAFLWPASAEKAFDSSYGGPFSQTDVVAAVIAGAGEGACAASSNPNCWSLEFDYDSVSKAGGMYPIITPLTSCPGTYGAASVSIAAGGVTSTYTSSNPCAINGTELEFVGGTLIGTFCSNGAPCGTPTKTGGTVAAPEIDPNSAMSALTLLAGCLAVFCGAPRPARRRASALPRS
jgi:hypothetical protein